MAPSPQLSKQRPIKDRLPGNRHSAIWYINAGYDLCVYVESPGRWVVHDGAAGNAIDQRVSNLLRGQWWPTRREAVEAAHLMIELIHEQENLRSTSPTGCRQAAREMLYASRLGLIG